MQKNCHVKRSAWPFLSEVSRNTSILVHSKIKQEQSEVQIKSILLPNSIKTFVCFNSLKHFQDQNECLIIDCVFQFIQFIPWILFFSCPFFLPVTMNNGTRIRNMCDYISVAALCPVKSLPCEEQSVHCQNVCTAIVDHSGLGPNV